MDSRRAEKGQEGTVDEGYRHITVQKKAKRFREEGHHFVDTEKKLHEEDYPLSLFVEMLNQIIVDIP